MKQQKICIIGNGLAGLISAAVLSKEDIKTLFSVSAPFVVCCGIL